MEFRAWVYKNSALHYLTQKHFQKQKWPLSVFAAQFFGSIVGRCWSAKLAPNLIKEHKSLINNLHEKGFTFDPAKTERSRRKNGTNQNFADFVFKNSMQCRI